MDTSLLKAILGTAATIVATGGTVTVAWMRRPQRDGDSATRVSLDRTQLSIIDGLRADVRTARYLAELWERRARRVDDVAHANSHVVAPFIMKGLIPWESFRKIPLLEDPFDVNPPAP